MKPGLHGIRRVLGARLGGHASRAAADDIVG
jgi:hypothetical protein